MVRVVDSSKLNENHLGLEEPSAGSAGENFERAGRGYEYKTRLLWRARTGLVQVRNSVVPSRGEHFII
jgi:hypothetical protein